MAGSLGDIHAHHTESFVALFLTMCYGLAVVGETSRYRSLMPKGNEKHSWEAQRRLSASLYR